uniref:Peptidase A2 domain-containing protein n=1 Tax=Trichuris muris TaxID=70415 RepID=A0A5S6QJM4_TRIMR
MDSQRPVGPTPTQLVTPQFTSDRPDGWVVFEERLDFFFTAQGIHDDEHKRAILLTAVCERTFDLLRSLAQPKKLKQCTFVQLVEKLRTHFCPSSNEILERFHFHSRTQHEGESVSDFVTDLRRLSAKCNFAELDNMLRDRLVCGLRDETLQRRLFAEAHLDFARALALAQAYEAARRDVSSIRSRMPLEVAIDRMEINDGRWSNRYRQLVPSGKTECPRCSSRQHDRSQCPFKSARCSYCQRIGHIQRACFLRKGKQTLPPGRAEKRRVNAYKLSNDKGAANVYESWHENASFLFNAHEETVSAMPPAVVWLRLNGKSLPMEIDSGASCTIISERTFFDVLHGQPPLQKVSTTLRTWSAKAIPVLGSITVTVARGNRVKNLKLLVVRGAGPNLLGRTWFAPLGISIVYNRQNAVHNNAVAKMKSQFVEVFDAELGKDTGHRKLLTPFDLMIPSTRHMKLSKVGGGRGTRSFAVGDAVLAQNFSVFGPKWINATVIKAHGNSTFTLRLESGHLIRRHIDQLLKGSTMGDDTDDLCCPFPEPKPRPTVNSRNFTETSFAEQPSAREASRPQRKRRRPTYLRDYHCFRSSFLRGKEV